MVSKQELFRTRLVIKKINVTVKEISKRCFQKDVDRCVSKENAHVLAYTLKKTSAAEACRDAKGLLRDDSQCSLAFLLASWAKAGHEERSFERSGC